MIPKASSITFTTIAAFAVLLFVSLLPAFEQGASGQSRGQAPEAEKQAEALFQEALLLSNTQERESARLRLQAAMRLWVQIGEPGKAGKAALQMGYRYKQVRKYLDALNYYQQALHVKSLPILVSVNALNAIASIYADLYHNDFAMRYFNKALSQARPINDLAAQTLALTGLAEIYRQQGEKEKELECITKAQELSKNGTADADPTLLYLMGQFSQEQGAVEKAKSAFAEALAINEKIGDVAGQVRALCALSALSLLASQKQAGFAQAEKAVALAEKQYKSAISHAEKVSARELRWRAWFSRARAARAMGENEKAIKSYSLATTYFEANWYALDIATEASAIAVREDVQAAYREYVDLLVEQGQFKRAYEVADKTKARVTLNRTAARRATLTSIDSDEEATQREFARSIVHMRLQLLASDLSRELQAKLQKDIEEAEYKLQEEQLNVELEHSRERLVWSNLVSAEQLQKKMAADQMALAEFSLGEQRSFVWLFSHGEISYEILPGRLEIEYAVRLYLDSLTTAPNPLHIETSITKLRAQSQALFTTLFGRLSPQIEPGQRLIVVPDGLLHYLPFETLIHNGRYLVEDHVISYNPSASMLGLELDSASQIESGHEMELLAIGAPILASPTTGIGGKGPGIGLNQQARQNLAARGFSLRPLPRARDEVQYIAGLFPPDRCKVLLGNASTETAIKRESLGRFRRLHFATHSLIDERFPLRSAIVLAPGNDAEEDGFLEVSEIVRLKLNCDLVVVSACQTGRGQLLKGEGIVGFSRAFLYAGARSVIVSLWNVSDISTGQLMKSFYQQLTVGMSNAASLRQAKLQMLGSGRETRHPYYWSSFVMVGKP